MNNPSLLLALALTGFVGWWATGIDDTLALGLLLGRTSQNLRWPILLSHVLSVIAILALASTITLGAIQLAPGLLETRVLGLPLQNLAGIMPIVIGLWALREALNGDDDADDHKPLSVARWRSVGGALILGAQVYLVNSVDDLALHLGILGGAIHRPIETAALLTVVAYWLGTLTGELSSLAAAHWLGSHFRTRRRLEIVAALTVIGVGGIVLLGGF